MLIDKFLDADHSALTVLDISQVGVIVAQKRLEDHAGRVTWIAQDVTAWHPPQDAFALWHDRAVFHFLVEAADRAAYVRALDRSLRPGGFVILAPFSLTGPERCSGLPVRRYSAAMLQAELGAAYALVNQQPQTHLTPAGKRQDFIWCLFRKSAT